jgi:type II secretory pathway component PulC
VTISPRIDGLLSGLPTWLERLLLLVLSWQLAGLFWLLFSPSTSDINLSMPRQNSAAGLVTRDAFLRWYVTEEKAETDKLGDSRLLAVIAGKNGAAVLKSGETDSVAARVGEEIGQGRKLVAVEPTQVTIEQAGVRHVLKLPQSATEPLVATVEQKPLAKRSLPQIQLTRGQMANLIQSGNVGAWDKGLSSAPDGGIRVENTATQPMLAKMLQLKSGDILKSVNQRPLNQLADISLLFHFFGQPSPVEIVLVRNGATLTQRYDIQP